MRVFSCRKVGLSNTFFKMQYLATSKHASQFLHFGLTKSFILLFALSFYCLLASAQQNVEISGFVFNSTTNEPVGFATVEARPSLNGGHSISTSAGEDGKFTMRLPAGKYRFTARLIGYKAAASTVVVEQGGNNRVALAMEEDSKWLGEVTVTGLSPTEKVSRLAYNVSMLETDKLKNTTLDLATAIGRINGVKIRQTGGVGSESNITLNGFSGRHVKVFIDGVPMDGMSSAFGLNNMPVNLAKRVEVYKGVVPIELGGDALGGAINIITDRSHRTRVNASYSYGSFNTHKSNVFAEYVGKKGFYVSLNAYQNYSDNDYKVNIDHYTDFENNSVVKGDFKVRRFHAMYHNEAAILKVGVVDKPFADHLFFGFTGGYEYSQTQNASTMDWVYGARYNTAATLMPTLSYGKRFDVLEGLDVHLDGNFNFGKSYSADTASCNYNWLGQRSKPKNAPGELEYMKYHYRNNNGAANFRMSLFPAEGHSVSLSSTFSTFSRSGKDDTDPDNASYDRPQNTYKINTGLSYKFDYRNRWNTSVFVKNYLNHLEAYLTPEGETTARNFKSTDSYWGGGLATTYFIGQHIQLRASYEYAYRLPNSRELFGSGDDVERGNSSLKPEHSNNVNFSLTARPFAALSDHQLTVDLALQYRNITDYIRRTTNSDNGRATSSNEGGVRNIGGDFGLRYTYKGFVYAGANFSYFDMRSMMRYKPGTQTESLNYKERIPAMPYMYGNGEAGVTLRDLMMKRSILDIHYMLSYVHDFNYEWNTYNNDQLRVPSQWSHDLVVSYTFGKKQDYMVALECMNMLDARLYDNFKMQKPGRSFSVKVAYNFNK